MKRRYFLQTMVLAGGAFYSQNMRAACVFNGKTNIRTFHIAIGSGALGIEGEIPNITPKPWKKKTNVDGSTYSGVSIHPPVIEENIESIKRAKALRFKKVLFDDDFRLGNYLCINSVLFWNLLEESKNLTVKFKNQLYTVRREGLNAKLLIL